jgi:hypothetical protein
MKYWIDPGVAGSVPRRLHRHKWLAACEYTCCVMLVDSSVIDMQRSGLDIDRYARSRFVPDADDGRHLPTDGMDLIHRSESSGRNCGLSSI